jgi:hypothetical protein
MRPGDVLSAARHYLRSHPEEFSRVIRNAIGMRFGVPLASFRWLTEKSMTAGSVARSSSLGEGPYGDACLDRLR